MERTLNPYKFFSPDEVAKWQLQPETWSMLDTARGMAGIPFLITSGKRTPEEEAALKGGVRDSAHISGYGFDLECQGEKALCLILAGLLGAGFKRIGIYHDVNNFPVHIHADSDPDLLAKTGPVMWIALEMN